MLSWDEIIPAFHLDIGFKKIKFNQISTLFFNYCQKQHTPNPKAKFKGRSHNNKGKNIPCVLHSIQKHK